MANMIAGETGVQRELGKQLRERAQEELNYISIDITNMLPMPKLAKAEEAEYNTLNG